MPKAGIRRRTGTGLALSDPAGHEEFARGSETELLLLVLHPDLGALRTFPLPLPVVDVPFELLHRDLALSTCHLYSSIAPKWLGAVGYYTSVFVPAVRAQAAEFGVATFSWATRWRMRGHEFWDPAIPTRG